MSTPPGCGQGDRLYRRMVFAQVRVQTIKVPAHYLGCVGGGRNKSRVDRPSAYIRAHRDPSQPWILKAGLRLLLSCVHPGEAIRPHCIQRTECFVRP